MESGVLTRERIEASARRVLTEKARLGLHKSRAVDLDAVPAVVGTRRNAAIARQVSERAMTLIKDDRNTCRSSCRQRPHVLYLSVLDYPRGWRIAAPSRVLLPGTACEIPGVQAIEISTRRAPTSWRSCAPWPRAPTPSSPACSSAPRRAPGGSTSRRRSFRLLQELGRAGWTQQPAVRGGVLRQPLRARWDYRKFRRCCSPTISQTRRSSRW